MGTTRRYHNKDYKLRTLYSSRDLRLLHSSNEGKRINPILFLFHYLPKPQSPGDFHVVPGFLVPEFGIAPDSILEGYGDLDVAAAAFDEFVKGLHSDGIAVRNNVLIVQL